LGNGLCSTVQAVQAQTFEGKYDGIFMTLSLTIVSAVLVVFVLVRERPQITSSLKIGALLMLVNGICNGFVNLLVMITSQMMEKSLFYPLISAGGIVLTWIISVFFYRGKLTALQNAGMILGVASIVFLNV
jgi:multidrug transporter EmrE-like cation transporter